MSKILIALPVLTYDIGLACLESIDQQFWKDVIIVDNTPDGKFARNQPVGTTMHNGTGKNIGLPASWNACIDWALSNDYDYLIFLSSSEIFEYGMRDFIEHINETRAKTGYRTNRPAWHCVALSYETLEKVGHFDENFWPAYQEDTDYIYRMKLAGLHDRYDGLNQMPKFYVAARTTGIARSIQEGGIEVDHEAHKKYYIEKWGGWDGDETFTHPYNDETKDIRYWRPR